MERRTIIPGSERRLLEAREGDVVKITILGHQFWCRFSGNKDGSDIFERQEPAGNEGDDHLVASYTSPQRTHQFDSNLGVILNASACRLEYYSPRKEGYAQAVKKLKQAGLWKE